MKSLNLTKPHLIVVVGIPGAGKTYFAEQFSAMFNAPFISTQEVETLVDNPETAKATMNYILEKLVQTKQTLLLEGFGSSRVERHDIAAFARKKGYQPLFIWVQTEPNTAHARATKGTTSMSRVDFEQLAEAFQPLSSSEKYMVISGKHTYASQARNVLKKLTESRAEQTKVVPAKDREASVDVPQPRTGRITIN